MENTPTLSVAKNGVY